MRRAAVLLATCSLVAGLLAAVPAALATSAGPTLATDLAGSFQPLAPKRVLDTRSGVGGVKGPLAPGQTVIVNLFDARPVLANDVSAAVIDVTVPTPAPATDRPLRLSAISIRNFDDTAWNRAPQISSSVLLQPTELTVGQGRSSAVALYSMTNTEVLVHIYVTGYYTG